MKSFYKNIYTAITWVLAITAAAGTVHASVIPAEKIKAGVIEQIKKIAADSGIEIEVTVPHVVDIDVGEIDDSVMKISIPGDKKIDSRMPVRVEICDRNGAVSKRFQYTARVSIFKTVAVVCSDLGRGEPITRGDIRMVKTDVTGFEDYFEEASQLDNMQANRLLRAGTVLTRRNVNAVPVIHRGDTVMIRIRVGNVFATASGIARQDGGKGEKIRVYYDMTRTILDCVVIDEKTVQAGL